MQSSHGFFMQFVRLAGQFWLSENKVTIQKSTFVLVLLTMMQIAVAVLITEWSAHLFNALDKHSMSDLVTQIFFIILIFIANIIITVAHLRVKRRLQIDWREWLTEHLIGRWMYKGRHYLISHIPGEHDNPDGRIAEDCRIATEYAIDMGHSLFYSALLLISFTEILWTLSGVIVVDLGFAEIPVYGHLVWLALIYACCASLLGWWIGRPLTRATNVKQTAEANFRFGLVSARENSQTIALIYAENKERQHFHHLFQQIHEIWQEQTKAWENILMFSSGYSVLSMAFPILISAPRYILGSISLGALMQSAQSFQQMASALSWPVDNLARIAEWRASVERILSLVKALDDLEQEMTRPDSNRIILEKSELSILTLHDVSIAKLSGEVLARHIDERISLGERVLINCNMFTGAKLFRAIAGLRPWGSGRIELPDDNTLFFMPPRPYLPKGSLRSAICYPSDDNVFNDEQIIEAMELSGVHELIEQLDQQGEWAKILSRETQQRLGLVRLLLYRPQWIFMQTAFDSLDAEGEEQVLRLICQQLPNSAMLTITNLETAGAFHHRRIILD